MKALTAIALVLSTTAASAHEGMLHEGCAAGQEFAAGDITVSSAFARATLPAAQVGAGYMKIENAGTEADTLVSAASEAAPSVELHAMTTEGGMMKMMELTDGIEIPAGGSVSLASGGPHVMFISPKAPFREGECVAVTLTFETAGPLAVLLVVGPIGADAPPEHKHQ